MSGYGGLESSLKVFKVLVRNFLRCTVNFPEVASNLARGWLRFSRANFAPDKRLTEPFRVDLIWFVLHVSSQTPC